MDSAFFPCRTSKISILGRFSALYFYPAIGVALLFVPFRISIELNISNSHTVEQLIILLLTSITATLLSCFLLNVSRKCFRMETRHILIEVCGFILMEKPNRWYAWQAIGGIGIIAFAANASKQNYQTQICIFLEPVSDIALKRLRDGYLFGAFNSDKYILMDCNPLTLNKLESCCGLPIVDFRPKQLKL